MSNYTVQDWQRQLQAAQSADCKEPVYRWIRPWLDVWARRQLQSETLKKYTPQWVLPEMGFPLVTRRRWGSGYKRLEGKTILIQGTGNGCDVVSWAMLKPARIIAVDLFPFESWNAVAEVANKKYGVSVEFYVAALDHLGFLQDASVDLCASDAVFEHVVNLSEAMREARRVLKPDGLLYAGYGPLWYCAGGDHFARGELRHAFNHLLLDKPTYTEYYRRYKLPVEDFQSGGRYIELDLFSHLRTQDYFDIYAEAGFRVDGLILEVSRLTLRFRNTFPLLFQELERRNPQCHSDDFVIKTHLVRLTRLEKES